MSASAMMQVLNSGIGQGEHRLMLFAIADNGGRASIDVIALWMNTPVTVAIEVANDAAKVGVVYWVDGETVGCDWLDSCGGTVRSKSAKPSNWSIIRAQVLRRDGAVCTYCGTESGPFHIDHVHPKSRGGSDDLGNLAVACARCNTSKGARTPEEWRCHS